MTPLAMNILTGAAAGLTMLATAPLAYRLAAHFIDRSEEAWRLSSLDWARERGATDHTLASLEALSPHAVSSPPRRMFTLFWCLVTALWAAGASEPALALIYVFASFLLFCASLVDLHIKILPDELIIAVGVIGILLSLTGHGSALPNAVIGFLTGGASFLSISILFRYLRGVEALGLGDVKLFAVIGLWIGVQNLAHAALVASLLGVGLFVVNNRVAAKEKTSPNHAIAFGPPLALSLIVVDTLKALGPPWN